MPHVDPIEDDVRRAVVTQLSAVLPFMPEQPNALNQHAEVGESFHVWALGLDDVAHGGDEVGDMAHATGLIHFQVRGAYEHRFFARAAQAADDPSGWRVMQVSDGELGRALEDTIRWIDDQGPDDPVDDPVARLLEIPAYQVTAIWLKYETSESALIAVWVPDWASALETERFYSSREFLSTLRDERVCDGLTFE